MIGINTIFFFFLSSSRVINILPYIAFAKRNLDENSST